jgi:biopolymer transport protein ExbD
MAKSLRVDLPQVQAPTEGEPVVINLVVHGDGVLELDGEETTIEHLSEQLVRQFDLEPTAVLRLGGARETPYEKIAQLLSIAQQNGISRIAFATTPPKGEE